MQTTPLEQLESKFRQQVVDRMDVGKAEVRAQCKSIIMVVDVLACPVATTLLVWGDCYVIVIPLASIVPFCSTQKVLHCAC
jgi:hypothetical protein